MKFTATEQKKNIELRTRNASVLNMPL